MKLETNPGEGFKREQSLGYVRAAKDWSFYLKHVFTNTNFLSGSTGCGATYNFPKGQCALRTNYNHVDKTYKGEAGVSVTGPEECKVKAKINTDGEANLWLDGNCGAKYNFPFQTKWNLQSNLRTNPKDVKFGLECVYNV